MQQPDGKQNNLIPEQLPRRAKGIGGEAVSWLARSASRFVGFQPMHDSWEYSDATDTGAMKRGRNVIGAGISGIAFPAATAALQADLTEIPLAGILFNIPGVKKGFVGILGAMDIAAWGHGGISILYALPFVSTAIWRAGTVALFEALPRRKEVTSAGLRRGL